MAFAITILAPLPGTSLDGTLQIALRVLASADVTAEACGHVLVRDAFMGMMIFGDNWGRMLALQLLLGAGFPVKPGLAFTEGNFPSGPL